MIASKVQLLFHLYIDGLTGQNFRLVFNIVLKDLVEAKGFFKYLFSESEGSQVQKFYPYFAFGFKRQIYFRYLTPDFIIL